MKEKINIKAASVVILSIIIGVYVIFYLDRFFTGIFIIAGGVSLSFIEFLKWAKEIYSWIRSNKESPITQTQENSPYGVQALATNGSKVVVKHYHSPDSPKKNTKEKKPILKPYFIGADDELVSELEVFPEFPIIEEKENIIPYSIWQMKKITESSALAALAVLGRRGGNSEAIKLDSVGMVIVNEGGSPAENIGITLTFPEQFEILEKTDLEHSPFTTLIHPPSPSYHGLHKHATKKNICEGWIKKIGNDKQFELDPIFPHTPDEDKVYNVKVSISQDNFPVSEELLRIKVSPKRSKIVKNVDKPDFAGISKDKNIE